MAAPRKDNVKELIIATTEKLLENKKLSDISLAEIAKNAGISKGTLYYHYKTKSEILFDITDKYLDEQYRDLVKWTEDETKDTSMHRLVKYILERDIATAGMRLHFFYDAMLGNEIVRDKLLSRYREFAATIGEKIGERSEGELVGFSAEHVAWALLLLSDGLFIHGQLGNGDLDSGQLIDGITNFVKDRME